MWGKNSPRIRFVFVVSKICFQDPSSYGKKLVLLKPRQMGLFPFTLNKHRNGRLSETVPFSGLYSETMEIKEDVQAGQVTERHHADVTSRRSGWQPWKCNIPYRLATASISAAGLEKVPAPWFKSISLSVGVLFQKRSRAKVLKAQFLKENSCFQHKSTICPTVDSFNVFMYVLLLVRERRKTARGENGCSWD